MGSLHFLRFSRAKWTGLAVLLGGALFFVSLTARACWAAPAAKRHHARRRISSTHSRAARVHRTRSKTAHRKTASRTKPRTRHATQQAKSHAKNRKLKQRAARKGKSTRLVEAKATLGPADSGTVSLPLKSLRAMPPLRGSRASLLRQNRRADKEGLTAIEDQEELASLASQKLLVTIPVSDALRIDPRLDHNRRYCRPWAAQFLKDFSSAYYAHFREPLQVNSAVRTVQFQQRLLRVNGNAAPARGEIASPHLTGEAVDIAKKGLSPVEIGWMRAYLLPLQMAGKIDVEEEFQQACFHISVYKSYIPGALPAPSYASVHERGKKRHNETSLLATGLE